MDWLVSIFYGFISGLSQVLPVSAGAHDFFLELMTRFDTDQPLMQLGIHLAAMLALLLFCRYRAGHVYRELRIASQPSHRRKRYPDTVAVLDGRVVLTMLIPAVIGVFLTGPAERSCTQLPVIVLLLLISGLVIYVPHFLAMGNRDSRHLSRAEAALFGVCAGLSAFPGISRTGTLLSVGALRGCGRSYVLDITLLLLIPLMTLLTVLDLFALVASGFAGITFLYFIQCLLGAMAAFGGASLAIATIRFLSVNKGYTVFAYYNWGLAVFGFILYLMI